MKTPGQLFNLVRASTPKAGSIAERAIALIRKQGHARSAALAKALDTDIKTVDLQLRTHANSGALVFCDILKPGKPREREYRIGSGFTTFVPAAFNVTISKHRPNFGRRSVTSSEESHL